jgi:hypothetical protein
MVSSKLIAYVNLSRYLCNKLHALALELVGLSELLGLENADVVLLVEGDRQLFGHFEKYINNSGPSGI